MLIDNMQTYCESIREFAATEISEHYTEDLNSYISLKQVEGLVVPVCRTKNNNYYISEKKHYFVIETIMDMIYGVGLAKLAGEDKIECAWDDESNAMVFWSKTQDE